MTYWYYYRIVELALYSFSFLLMLFLFWCSFLTSQSVDKLRKKGFPARKCGLRFKIEQISVIFNVFLTFPRQMFKVQQKEFNIPCSFNFPLPYFWKSNQFVFWNSSEKILYFTLCRLCRQKKMLKIQRKA